jgi:ubiquinone/menaquinone biosynthesis C-methylase UbiE
MENRLSEQKPSQTGQIERHAEIRRLARDHFDRWALGYDRSKLNELIFFPTVRVCLEEITRWQQLYGKRPFRMLDVGCGTGTLLTFVARQSQAELLIGLDYSPVMIRHLCEKIADSPLEPRVQALVGDAERLPFADESFDVVTCCNSFHHYPHQAAAIADFRRVLRPDGLLILIDGFRDNVIGWVVFDVAVATVEGNVHHASWSEVREMIHAAGFKTLRQRKVNVLAPILVSIGTR